jgi:hypothetical protein
MEEGKIINGSETKLKHAGRGSMTVGLNSGGEVIEVEEFTGVHGILKFKPETS